MDWPYVGVFVEANGIRYVCFCNNVGIEAFGDGRLLAVWRAPFTMTSSPPPADLRWAIRSMEVAVVADAYGVDARVVEGMAR